MKKILYFIFIFSIFATLLETGCTKISSDVSEVPSIISSSCSDLQIDYWCEDNENGYYFVQTPSGYEIYRQSKKNHSKTLIRFEKNIRNLILSGDWLYYIVAEDSNICRVKTNGQNYSVVFNYKSLQDYEDEPMHSLRIIDNLIFIQMSFGFYRYDMHSQKLMKIDSDARQISFHENNIYFCGVECTIYKMNLHDDNPHILLKSEKIGSNKDKWKDLYKTVIVVGDVLYYYKRNPDGLYSYKDEKSKLITNDEDINESTFFEHEGKLFYLTLHDDTMILTQYDPYNDKLTELSSMNDYYSGGQIIDDYFYYNDSSGEYKKTKI